MEKAKTKAELEQEVNDLKHDIIGLSSNVRVLEITLQERVKLHEGIVRDWNALITSLRDVFGVEAYSDGSIDSNENLIWSFRDVTTGETLVSGIKHADIGAGYIQAIKKRVMIPDRGMLDAIQQYTPGVDLSYLGNQFVIPLWLTALQSKQDGEELQRIVKKCYDKDGTV